MRRTQKALAALALTGMTLGMLPFNAFAAGTLPQRLAGVNAAQTAVDIAEQTGWTGSAILASSTSYGMVDALTSGPLASFLKAPILLQEAGSALNEDTKAELIKLEVKTVYVTSGTAVISQDVLDELTDMDITVVPLGGKDRFETSVNIANKMVELGAEVSKVAVAYGWLNQDALSIASIASAQTEPILLTEKNSIPDSVKEFLIENESVVATDVIGGPAVISEAVESKLPDATRYFGNTAYDTNLAVLKAFDEVLEYDNVFVANGETAIDALAGAPLAAQFKAGIVLINGTANEGTNYIVNKSNTNSIVTALGGPAVITDNFLTDLLAAQTKASLTKTAIEKIDSIVLNGDASGVNEQDLIDAGVKEYEVFEAHLEAYRAAISAAADLALDSTAKIQQMVTDVYIAQTKLANENAARTYAITQIDGVALNAPAPNNTLDYLRGSGVTPSDVIDANLAAYQAAISAAADLALDTTAEIQQMVTDVNTAQAAIAETARLAAIAKIDGIAFNGDASAVTCQDLIEAGVMTTDVTTANLAAYQTAISVAADLALDTTVEIQQMVTDVNEAEAAKAAEQAEAARLAAIAKIDGIALNGDASAVTLQDFIDAGVFGSTIVEPVLSTYQAAVSAAVDFSLNTTAKIQQMVYDVNRTL